MKQRKQTVLSAIITYQMIALNPSETSFGLNKQRLYTKQQDLRDVLDGCTRPRRLYYPSPLAHEGLVEQVFGQADDTANLV